MKKINIYSHLEEKYNDINKRSGSLSVTFKTIGMKNRWERVRSLEEY